MSRLTPSGLSVPPSRFSRLTFNIEKLHKELVNTSLIVRQHSIFYGELKDKCTSFAENYDQLVREHAVISIDVSELQKKNDELEKKYDELEKKVRILSYISALSFVTGAAFGGILAMMYIRK